MQLTKNTMQVPGDIQWALQEIRRSYPKAIVAGGCLRDTFFGVPVKDIDVFVGTDFRAEDVRFSSPFDFITVNRGIGMLTEYGSGGPHKDSPIAGWDVNLRGVATPVQVIARDFDGSIEALVADLDFGFCQIAYDGTDVWVTQAFLNDALRDTATFTSPLGFEREARAHRRADRLREKYPTRYFILPPPF